MRIALAQMEVKPGLVERNFQVILDMIAQAKEQGAELVVFPEMCVGGYMLGDLFTDEDFCEDLAAHNELIRDAAVGIVVAWGNICVDSEDAMTKRGLSGFHPNRDGRTRKYNAVFIAQNGEWAARKSEHPYLPKGVTPKTLLPNYRFFDDARYFFSTKAVADDFGVPLESLLQPFVLADSKLTIGFQACEDLWCNDYRQNTAALNPTDMLIQNGAELICNLSASPWTHGKNHARDRRVKFLKEQSGKNFVPFVYVNAVGAQNTGKNIVTFDGGSTAYNREGHPIALCPKPYAQKLLVCENFDGPVQERPTRNRIQEKYQAVVEAIKRTSDWSGSRNAPSFIIGLSGGIDSAVSLSLLVDAVGAQNVAAVNMPSQYNSDKTQDAAKAIANNFGVNYHVIPIEDQASSQLAFLSEVNLGQTASDTQRQLFKENLYAKFRGTGILSNLAGRDGFLMVNNGNKLEVFLGYATLYGDWNGAIAPIADFNKAELFALVHLINDARGAEVLPQALVPDSLFRFSDEKIAPSAELEFDQRDPIKFGYHCGLIDLLMDYQRASVRKLCTWYADGTLHHRVAERLPQEVDGLALFERYGLTSPQVFLDDLNWFVETGTKQVFKRIQAPPIVVTSKSAFGSDYRESQLPHASGPLTEIAKESVLNLPRYSPTTD